jgi:hypothetical protein
MAALKNISRDCRAFKIEILFSATLPRPAISTLLAQRQAARERD